MSTSKLFNRENPAAIFAVLLFCFFPFCLHAENSDKTEKFTPASLCEKITAELECVQISRIALVAQGADEIEIYRQAVKDAILKHEALLSAPPLAGAIFLVGPKSNLTKNDVESLDRRLRRFGANWVLTWRQSPWTSSDESRIYNRSTPLVNALAKLWLAQKYWPREVKALLRENDAAPNQYASSFPDWFDDLFVLEFENSEQKIIRRNALGELTSRIEFYQFELELKSILTMPHPTLAIYDSRAGRFYYPAVGGYPMPLFGTQLSSDNTQKTRFANPNNRTIDYLSTLTALGGFFSSQFKTDYLVSLGEHLRAGKPFEEWLTIASQDRLTLDELELAWKQFLKQESKRVLSLQVEPLTLPVKKSTFFTHENFFEFHPDLDWFLKGVQSRKQQDFKSAHREFSKAAQYASKPALLMLSDLYQKGLGVTADPIKAYAFLHLAAERQWQWLVDERNALWDTLNDEQRGLALAQVKLLSKSYADSRTQKRLERRLIKGHKFLKSKFVDPSEGISVKYIGEGDDLLISEARLREDYFWEPTLYWQWQQKVFSPGGDVSVGKIRTVSSKKER